MDAHAKALNISSQYKTEQSSQLIYAHEDMKDDQQTNSQQTDMHIIQQIIFSLR